MCNFNMKESSHCGIYVLTIKITTFRVFFLHLRKFRSLIRFDISWNAHRNSVICCSLNLILLYDVNVLPDWLRMRVRESTQPRKLIHSLVQGILFPLSWWRGAGTKNWHRPPPNTETKNEWSYNSTPHVFMTCKRKKFTFTQYLQLSFIKERSLKWT